MVSQQRRVLLYQLDGSLPNLALMRISSFYKQKGHQAELRRRSSRECELWDDGDEIVFASLIFEKSRPEAEKLKRSWPQAIIGGTGWDLKVTLEQHGIQGPLDYDLYPNFQQSIGFSQRGCRLKCPFCVVPQKEGGIREEQGIGEIWRGEPWPREVILLDNDFFGQPRWCERIEEIQRGGFKVNFNQGINVRFLNDESAAALASVDYREYKMREKRLHTAWDNRKDEARLFEGLNRLVNHGVKPGHIMVYMLIGYWPGETDEDWEYRREKIRAFGADPYPMPFHRTEKTVGFQRFTVGAYDKRISWREFKKASFRPEKLGVEEAVLW